MLAHTGTPDVEAPQQGILRHPDIMDIAEADMEVEGAFDPRALLAAIEVVSRSNPDNDWTSKTRDYPLLGIPVYVIFDPCTGEGTVFSDIHTAPQGPRYATRKDFVYGEDVTIDEWTILTDGLPRYPARHLPAPDTPPCAASPSCDRCPAPTDRTVHQRGAGLLSSIALDRRAEAQPSAGSDRHVRAGPGSHLPDQRFPGAI